MGGKMNDVFLRRSKIFSAFCGQKTRFDNTGSFYVQSYIFIAICNTYIYMPIDVRLIDAISRGLHFVLYFSIRGKMEFAMKKTIRKANPDIRLYVITDLHKSERYFRILKPRATGT